MKKRTLTVAALFVFTLGLLTACDFLEECANCKLITEDGDGNITEGTALPLCGDALIEREEQQPVTDGTTTTYWECL